MSVEVVTKEDLQTFRIDLLNDIQTLLSKGSKPPKEWLKSTEVRALLKISAGTLQTLRVKGKLHYSKVGGTYYYRQQEVQRMLEAESH